MSLAGYNMYTRKKGKPLRIMALPPTEANLLFHMKRVHMQVMLWKAADRQGPLPFISIMGRKLPGCPTSRIGPTLCTMPGKWSLLLACLDQFNSSLFTLAAKQTPNRCSNSVA